MRPGACPSTLKGPVFFDSATGSVVFIRGISLLSRGVARTWQPPVHLRGDKVLWRRPPKSLTGALASSAQAIGNWGRRNAHDVASAFEKRARCTHGAPLACTHGAAHHVCREPGWLNKPGHAC